MKRSPRRLGGSLDLLLVGVTLWAASGRTPVGGLVDRAAHLVIEPRHELASLTSFFVTGPPPEVVVEAVVDGFLPEIPRLPSDGAFPEPFRTAARFTVGDRLPPAVRDLAAELSPEDDVAVALLDHLWTGDPEATLEAFAIGPEQRARAIRRAEAAGDPAPQAYETHRRYLAASDARRADRIVSATLALGTALRLRWPIEAEHRVSSPYGRRVHPVLKKERFHNGVDLAVPIGTPVLAAQAGEVAVAAEDRVNGRYVVLDHGHGLRTSYCHLDSYAVREGDRLASGVEIGRSGNTGRSTGPHLHFTVRIGRRTVDPLALRPAAPEDAT